MNNENYQAAIKKHVGGNENLTINFSWPNVRIYYAEFEITVGHWPLYVHTSNFNQV